MICGSLMAPAVKRARKVNLRHRLAIAYARSAACCWTSTAAFAAAAGRLPANSQSTLLSTSVEASAAAPAAKSWFGRIEYWLAFIVCLLDLSGAAHRIDDRTLRLTMPCSP